MIDEKNRTSSDYSNKKAAAYSLGQASLVIALQSFTFLIFTFYFTIVGLNVLFITLGFIIWSVWNSFNDPMMGHISDRTHTKWGRRRPYIMIALVPLAIIMVLLFTPPSSFGNSDQLPNFLYFVIIIMLFDLFYTMYDINVTSLFPELFITMEERTKAQNIRQSFGIIALVIAFILPTLIIPDLSDKKYLLQYQLFGITAMILIIVVGLTFLKFSPREKLEFKEDYKNSLSFIKGLKLAGKNKSFTWFIVLAVGVNFVDLMLPTMVPLYGKFVLGIGEGESFYLSLMLGLFFISAAISMNIFWKPLVQKLGLRKSWFIAILLWIILLSPILFISDKYWGMIVFFIAGFGFAGCYYLLDLALCDVIDEDEVNTGTRKEATYFGVYILSIRLAAILVFLSISVVFTNVGWTLYEPEAITPQVIFGLRALMFILPAIALLIGMIAAYKNPLHGERLKQVKEKLKNLHEEKRASCY